MKHLTIVKLGGSVITNKDETPPSVNKNRINRIGRELGISKGPMIVVLGGGAHGHQAARKYGFGDIKTPKRRRLAGVPEIRHNMSLLSLKVIQSLQAMGLPAVIFPPFAFVNLVNNHIQHFPCSLIEKALESNLLVVTHGDVCFDDHLGASILSGDTIVVYLANRLNPSGVYIGTDVDGVFTDNPNLNPDAKIIPVIQSKDRDEVLSNAGPSSSVDVTGGMDKKIKELFNIKQNTRIAIFNLTISGRLSALLTGKTPTCTIIQP
ncbi:MAG: isopentenyl phosphate kinase [Candidatus Thorarchaeota archaeon]